MTELFLIGIGTGNPDHVTIEARKAIANADLIMIPRKGAAKSDLAEIRHAIVSDIFGQAPASVVEFDLPVRDPELPYLEAVERWHDAIAQVWSKTMAQSPEATRVALLVWGDPSLYDSTLRIAGRLTPMPRMHVVPGITSLQVLTAAHAIPLNTVGRDVTITTGRRLREHGWPEGQETIAVMLDGSCAFETLKEGSFYIWWGAFLGMPEQILKSGPLQEMAPEIIETRRAARESHGWIMDIYLIRRRD